jgi:outer membrane autotransporter protein
VLGSVINLGTMTSTGRIIGGLNQLGGSSATLSGTLNGEIRNGGALTVSGNLTSNNNVQTSGTSTTQILSGARWSGLLNFSNSSTNENGVVISGALDVSGAFSNVRRATTIINDGGVLTAQIMTNLGTVTNDGTVNSMIANSGMLINSATWNGALLQGLGTVINDARWNGGFGIDTGGLVTNNGSWANTSGVRSDVRGGTFENFGTLTGSAIFVRGADALLANRTGGVITLDNRQFLIVGGGGIIVNAGTITAAAEVLSGGIVQNNASGVWNGPVSIAATGSVTNAGTITTPGSLLNQGTLVSTGIFNGLMVNENGANASLSGIVNGNVSNSGKISLIGSTSGIRILDQTSTGVFDTGGFDTTIGVLQGAGLVQLRDGDLTLSAASGASRYSGGITGSGGLFKTGGAILTLTGDMAYTGLTQVDSGTLLLAGGVLTGSVFNNASFAMDGRVRGGLTNNRTAQIAGQIDGAVLNRSTITSIGDSIYLGRFTQIGGATFNLAGFNASLGSMSGEGLITLGSGFMTVGTDNSSSVFDGVISGTGGVVKAGTGTFTVNGVNTYTGTTFVNAGTLVIGGEGLIALPTNDAAAAEAVTVAAPLLKGGAALLTGGGAEFFNGFIEVTLDGSTGEQPSPATVEVAGEAASSLAPAAMNTALSSAVIAGSVANNATLINNGTILGQLVNNSGATANNHGVIAGAVLNNGTLVSTGTLGGGLANNGQAAIQGVLDSDVINTGTVTLTGATTGIDIFEQSENGIFNLAGFDTTIGAISGGGSITLRDARLTTGTDGIATLFSGVMSGNGGLTKVGTGRLVLTGGNTYNGGTTISGGVLQLGDGGTNGSVIGPVVNNGALMVNRSDAYTFAGAISGNGMFVQDGTGTTTLTGANTYSGGTLISRGRLVGNTTSLRGQIQNDAALEFAQGAGGVFAGQLFGAGLFDKTGAGILTLTGNSNGLTGGTFVRAGELRLTGSLANSRVTVLSGATLSGTGVIGGLVANSGSIIAPGVDGAGMLGVNGAVNLATGSTVELQVRATGVSDMIVATGAASLGGTAAFTNLGGPFAFNSEYLLLQADGGRTGTFDAASGFAGFGILYRPELVYSATQVRLRMAPNLLENIVGNTELTANQRSVVNRIDGAVTAGFNPQALFNVYALPTTQLPDAFDQLSGEVYATAAGVGIEQERLLREAVLGRAGSIAMAARAAPEAGKGMGAWGQLFGGWGNGDSDGNTSSFESDRGGFVTGLDIGNASEAGAWRLGVFGMHITSDVTIARLGSNAGVEQSGGGAYASFSTGGLTAVIGGYLTTVDLRGSRNIALPGFNDTLAAETNGDASQGFAELSYTIGAGKGSIRPFVAGAIGSFKLDALTERGGVAALDMAGQSYSTGSVTAGADAMIPAGKGLMLLGTLAGRAQLGDRDPQAQLALAAAPQQGFAVSGVQLDKFALAARLEAVVGLDDNVDFTVGYTGLIGSSVTDHGARATLQVRF